MENTGGNNNKAVVSMKKEMPEKERVLQLKPHQLNNAIIKLYPQLGGTKPARHIGDAMAVFEMLRESGEWCCLSISSDYCYRWTIHLTKSGKLGHEPVIHVASEEGLAPTICRAVLLADLYIREEK
mgnify:CR=1 FL=1